MTTRFDSNDQMIGEGDVHAHFSIEEFEGFPIRSSVQESISTESVYVVYTNEVTGAAVQVRFSGHCCNAVRFGEVIDGYGRQVREQILFRLGLATRRFVPAFVNHVITQAVAAKRLANYEMASLTLEEIKALPAGSDISEFCGKIAKDSNYLIKSDRVLSVQQGGKFIYEII